MKQLTVLLAALILTACDQSSPARGPVVVIDDPDAIELLVPDAGLIAADSDAGPVATNPDASPMATTPDASPGVGHDEPDPEVDDPSEEEAPCRVETKRVDRMGDGVFDLVYTNTFDDDGRLVREVLRDEEGELREETRHHYTADGLLRQVEFTRHGEWRLIQRTTHTYDDERRLLSTEVKRATTGALSLRRRTAYSYAAAGHLATETIDRNGDGYINDTRHFLPDGQLSRWEADRNRDGELEFRYTHTYDERGNQVEMRLAMPHTVILTTWTYDADDRLLLREVDGDGDGIIDDRETHTYDSDGNLVLSETDKDLDGTPNQWVVYTHNGDGDVLSSSHHTLEEGVTSRTEYRYDEDGRKVFEERRDGEGDIKMTEVWIYDAAGNELVHETQGPPRSPLSERVTQTYDQLGNIVEFTRDKTRNGVGLDYRVQFSYSCSGAPQCTADECIADEGCEAFCSDWGQCVQTCHDPVPSTPATCRALTANVVAGSPCRSCGGVWTPAGAECEGLFECVGGHRRNQCGGCVEMPVHPGGHYDYAEIAGNSCGNDYYFHCRDRDFLSCSAEGEPGNACLYDDELESQAGRRCEGEGTYCYYACEMNEAGDDLVCLCD